MFAALRLALAISPTAKGFVMKKAVVGGLVAGALVVAAVAAAKNAQPTGTPEEREAAKAAKREEMFAKMAANMESMPEDFPPVALFNNIAAIRENTDRILEALDKE